MDLAYTSAPELAGLIRSRAVSPVEVVRTTLPPAKECRISSPPSTSRR